MYSFVHREREQQRPRTRSKTITTALILFVVTTRCVQLGLTIFKQNPLLYIGASATESGYGGYVMFATLIVCVCFIYRVNRGIITNGNSGSSAGCYFLQMYSIENPVQIKIGDS